MDRVYIFKEMSPPPPMGTTCQSTINRELTTMSSHPIASHRQHQKWSWLDQNILLQMFWGSSCFQFQDQSFDFRCVLTCDVDQANNILNMNFQIKCRQMTTKFKLALQQNKHSFMLAKISSCHLNESLEWSRSMRRYLIHTSSQICCGNLSYLFFSCSYVSYF